MTLNGLEAAIEKGLRLKYNIKERGIYIGKLKNPTGKVKCGFLRTQVSIVRFADDFVILARSRRMLEEAVVPCLNEFLRERGLQLSEEKTKIVSIRAGEKLDFLGYTFQYQETFSYKYKLFHDRQEMGGIACYPQQKKCRAIEEKLEKIFESSRNLTSYSLIAQLNPIIRG